MINPIILSCGSFLIFWYIIYFLRDDGFWGRIVSQPSWGDNQIMIIFVTSVLLLVSLVYFFKILKIETKNIEFVYLALYIFMVSASGFVYSISYSEKEATLGFISTILASMTILFFLKSRGQKLIVSSLVILALSVYLTMWSEKISFKQS
jgi:hypothetical protein